MINLTAACLRQLEAAARIPLLQPVGQPGKLPQLQHKDTLMSIDL
jgi:hypothetical protein